LGDVRLSRNRCRQAENVAGFATARDQFKAYGRQMVAFVNDEMPIIADDVIDFSLASEVLDQGDVNLTCRLATTTADPADRVTRHICERCEPLDPLIHELTAVNEDQCIPSAFGHHPDGQDRLTERRRRREHAGIMRQQCCDRGFLIGA
jgi:hypothetical protein